MPSRSAPSTPPPSPPQLEDPHPLYARARGHLAFGQGIHFRIGAQLARMEARIAVDVLVRRLPGLRLLPDPRPSMPRSVTIRRLGRLDVAWDAPAPRGEGRCPVQAHRPPARGTTGG